MTVALTPYQARLRAREEMILDWLRLRCSGVSCAAVADLTGFTEAVVRVATCEVMADDLKYSGENKGRVRSAYWGQSEV